MIQQSHCWAYTLRKPEWRDKCTPMVIAALFIIARTWKQPRCPWAGGGIKKLWFIYTVESYSAIIKNNTQLNNKDPDVGKDWRREETGTTEDEMVGWHHRLDGHESEQVLGVGDGQGGLACCSPWGHKELDTPERLNWTEYSRMKQCRLQQHGWM